jgi:hypothetical protein
MDKIEALTRSQIRDYVGEHMYVLNVSDHNNTRPRQELLMTFRNNGSDVIVNIPNTWIPLDLTSRVNIAQIKENRDFWLFVNRRDLAVISTEIAEDFLDEPDAQDEYDRIFGIATDDNYSISLNRNNSKNSLKRTKLPRGSVKVISIMKKDVTETMKLAALKNIKHELTEDDFNYIMSEAKVGESEKIKSWISDLKRA